MNQDKAKEIAQSAKIAAAWWRRALEGRYLSDAGDPSINMLTAIAQKTITSESSPVDIFEAKMYIALIDRMSVSKYPINLDVDYGPEGMLAFVYDDAGVRGQFPFKTHMIVSPGDVTVSCGYQAPIKRLLGKAVWRVELYRVASRGRNDRPESSDWMTVYRGTNESEARELHALALKALPSNGLLNAEYDRNRPHLSLTKDSSYESS